MAVTFVGSSAQTTEGDDSGQTITVNFPSHLAGDLLVAWIQTSDADEDPSIRINSEAGWTEIVDVNVPAGATPVGLYVAWHIATSDDEILSNVFNTQDSTGYVATGLVYRGVDQITPIDIQATGSSQGNALSNTTPSVTTTVQGVFVNRIIAIDDNLAVGTTPSPSGYALRKTIQASAPGNGVTGLLYDMVEVTAGATGTEVISWTVDSEQSRSFVFGLRPDSEEEEFEVDAILMVVQTETFTIDAFVGVFSETFTVDSLLKATQTKTFTVDSLIQKLNNDKTFTIDSKLVRLEKFTIDALLKASGNDGNCGATIQSGTVSFTGTTTDVTLPNAVVLANSFLTFQYNVDNPAVAQVVVRGQLTTTTNIHFERTTGGATVDLSWYVVEYPSFISSQRGSLTMTATTNNQTITSVDTAKSFSLASWEVAGSSWGDGDTIRHRLTTSTNLEFLIDVLPAGFEPTIDWEVVEFTGVRVIRGITTFASLTTSEDIAIASVDLNRSIVHLSNTINGDIAIPPDDHGLTGELTTSTNLHIERVGTGHSMQIAWEVTEFPANVRVQSGSESLGTTQTVANVAISSVDLNRTAVLISHDMRGGRTSDSVDDNPHSIWYKAELTTSTNLQLTRASASSSTGDVVWYVIEFSPKQQKCFDLDAILIQRKEFTVDGCIQDIRLKTFSVDTFSQAEDTKTFTVDGCIQAENSKSFLIDSILKATQTETFTLDAFVQAQGDNGDCGAKIQMDTATLAVGQTSLVVNIDPISLSNSYLITNQNQAGTAPNQFLILSELGTSTVTFTRNADEGTDIPISLCWYVVEYPERVSSQRGTNAMATTTVNQTITSVDITKSFPIVNWKNGGILWGADDAVRARLTSSTNLELLTNLAINDTLSWQVIEYTGASVQRGIVTFDAGVDTSTDIAITTVDRNRSVAIVTDAKDSTSTPSNAGLTAELTTDSNLHIERASSTGNTNQIAWVVIQFPPNVKVQFGTETLGTAQTVANVTINQVKVSNTLAFLSHNYKGGRGGETVDQDPSSIWYTSQLTSATNLQLVRGLSSGSTSDVSWFVVEFTPTQHGCALVDGCIQDIMFETFTIDALIQKKDNDEEFTVDAIVVNRFDETFTVDAIVVNRFDETFTVDAFIQKTQTETFDIDAFIQKTQTESFSVDTFSQAEKTKTFTVDSFIQRHNINKDFTVDGLIQRLNIDKTFTVDAFIQKTKTETFIVDSLTQGEVTKTFTVDALTQRQNINKDFTVNALIQKQDNDEEFDEDAFIQKTKTETFDVDGLIQALNQEETFTIDAFVQAKQTEDFTVDAFLQATQTETFDIDALIQVLNQEETFTVDAVLRATFDEDFTVDAFVRALNQEKTFTVDTLIQAENEKMFLVDGLAQATQTETFDVDSIVVNRFDEDFTVDSKVIVRRTKTFTIDGLTQRQNIDKTFLIDAFVQKTKTKTFLVDAFVQATKTKDFLIDGCIRDTINEDFTVDAFIQRLDIDKTFTIDAFIQRQNIDKDFLIDGCIRETFDKDFTIDGFPQATIDEDFTIDSFIQKLDNDKTFLVDAKTTLRPDKSFVVDGLTQGAITKTFEVDALTEAEKTRMFLVDGVLQATINEDFLIDGLTKATQTETFTVDAKIAQKNTEVFDIDALIKDTFDETFTVDSLIEDTFDEDFTIESILLATQTETFLIDARIEQINTETFTIDSSLSKKQATTFEIDSQITQVQTKDFTVDSKLAQRKLFKIDAQIVRVERFDVDSILQATFTEVFLVDSILKQGNQEFFLIDGLLVTVNQETFSVDAVLAETKTKTFEVDTLIQKQDNDKTFIIDGLLPVTNVEEFDVDSRVLATVDEDFAIDSFVLATQDEVFDIDARIELENTKTFIVDSLTLGTQTESFSVDTFSQELKNTKDFTVDARLRVTNTEVFTIDSIVIGIFDKDFTVDGQLFAVLTFNKDFEIDGIIKALATEKDFTMDGIPVIGTSRIWCIDALLQANNNDKTFSVDAKVVNVNTEDFTVDAQLIPMAINTEVFTVDALLKASGTDGACPAGGESVSTVLDNIDLFDTQVNTTLTNFKIGQRWTPTPTEVALLGNGITKITLWHGHTGGGGSFDTFVWSNATVGTSSETVVRDAGTFTFIGTNSTISKRTRILFDATGTNPQIWLPTAGVEYVLGIVENFPGTAQTRKTSTDTNNGVFTTRSSGGNWADTVGQDWALQLTVEQAGLGQGDQNFCLSIDGRLLVLNTQDFTVGAVLLRELEINFTVDSIVTGAQTKTFIVDAQIFLPTLANFTVDGFLEQPISLLEFTVDARIESPLTQVFTVDSILIGAGQKVFTIDGLTLGTQTLDFTIDADIRNVKTDTFEVDAFIQILGDNASCQAVQNIVNALGEQDQTFNPGIAGSTGRGEGLGVRFTPKITFRLKDIEWNSTKGTGVGGRYKGTIYLGSTVPTSGNFNPFFSTVVAVADIYGGFTPNPEASFVQFWNLASQFRRTTFDAKGTNDGVLLQAGVQYFLVLQEVDINSGWTLSTTTIPPGNSSTNGSNPLTEKFITVEGTEHWNKVTSIILEAIQLTDEEFAFNMGVNAPTAGASCLQIDSILLEAESKKEFTVDAKVVRLDLFTVDALLKQLGDIRCSSDTIIFQDDFTTNAGWSVIGTQIEIDVADSNILFINCMRSNTFLNNQAVKTLPTPINQGNVQLADIIFEFDHFHFKPCGLNFTMPAPFASNADWAFTETNLQAQLNPAQAMLSYEFFPIPPASNQDPQGIKATYADGITEVSTSLISLVDNTQYFPRITKQLNGILKLEIFLDSGRTIHASGSPVQVDASAVSNKQLNFIQLANASSGGQARRLKANIDNVILVQSLCPQVTVDALIGLPEKQFLVDAILSTQGKFTVDAFLIIINTETFEIDSRVKALDTEKTFSVDAEITRGKIFLVNSIIKLIADKVFTIDSRLSGIEEFNVDAKLVDRFEEEFTIDGSTLGTVEKDFTVDGILIVFPSGLTLIDAVIQAQNNDKIFTVDSRIKALETTKDFTVDSQLVQDEIPKQFTIDGRIAVIQTTTFDIDGIIKLAGENGTCNFFPPTNISVDTGFEQFIGPVQPLHETGVEMLIGQEVTLTNQQVRSVTFLLRSTNFPNEITTNSLINAEIWSDVVIGNFGGETTEASSENVINAINTSGDLPPGDWTKIKFTFDVNTTPFLTGDFVVGFKHLSSVEDTEGVGTAIPVISNSNVISGNAVHRKGANSGLGEEDQWVLLTEDQKDMIIQLEVLNGDDILIGTGHQCPLVDAILVNIPDEFLVDSILTNRFESEFSVDTVLFPFPKPFSIDAVLVGTQLPFIVDSIIVPEPKTFTVDALILVVPGKLYNIDAVIFGEDTNENFLVDSFVKALSKDSPKFNLNAFLFVRRTKDFTMDGSTKFFNKVAPFTIDALVIFFPSQLPQVDGLLKRVGAPKFFFVDAFIQKLNNLLFPFTDVDALIVRENIGKTFLVEGLIEQGDNEKDFTVDARLSVLQDPFLFTVDGIMVLENHRWRVDALLQKSINKLFLIEAFVVGNPQKPFLISGLTKGFDINKTFIIDGLLKAEPQKSFLIDARIFQPNTGDHTVDAIIKGIGLTIGFTIDTSLVRTEEFSINGIIQALGDGETFTGNNGSTNPNNSSDPFVTQPTDDNTITLPIGTLVGQRLRLITAPVRVTSYTFVIHRAGTAGTPTGTLTGKIYKNSIAGNTISGADLIATSDNVVNLASITTNTNGQNVTFTFTTPPEITVDDNVFIGFDIAGSNEQMFLHTESTGTVIDGGDVTVESSGTWGVDLGVDAVLTILIDIEQRQRASSLMSSFVGRFSPQFEVNSLVKAFDVEFEFTVSANIRFKRIEEFFIDAVLIGSQDFTVSAFVGDTLFIGLDVESVIVENNSTTGIESVIVENNSDIGVESVIGQDT